MSYLRIVAHWSESQNVTRLFRDLGLYNSVIYNSADYSGISWLERWKHMMNGRHHECFWQEVISEIAEITYSGQISNLLELFWYYCKSHESLWHLACVLLLIMLVLCLVHTGTMETTLAAEWLTLAYYRHLMTRHMQGEMYIVPFTVKHSPVHGLCRNRY